MMKFYVQSGFHGFPGRQRGVVTLAIGIVLLLLITLVTLYGARVTILEQRISANDYRAREASSTAQAGLNYGIEYARANQQTMRSAAAGGWLDGAAHDPSANPEWSDPVSVDCSPPGPMPGTKEKAVCDSGFDGEVRFFGAQALDFDVPLNWPVSVSKALSDCSNTPDAGDPPCRIEVEYVLCEFIAAPPDGQCVDSVALGSSVPQYAVLVLARGVSADGTAQSSVRQILTPFDLLPGNAVPPLMASGNVAISGTLDIVINPDGAGPGTNIPISGWANSDLQYTGNAAFCYPDEYFLGGLVSENNAGGADLLALPDCNDDLGNQPCVSQVTTSKGLCPMSVCDTCDCPTTTDTALTTCSGSVCEDGIDVVDKDGDLGATPDATNFPDDVFEYVFGVPGSDYQAIKNNAQIAQSCAGINSESSGLFWIEGNCSITGTGGSPDGPVALVVEGDFQMTGGGQFFGLTFLFSNPPSIPGGSVKVAGGTRYYGVIVSDHQVDIGNGTYHLVYSECMIDQLRSDDTFRRLGPVPGTWADHM